MKPWLRSLVNFATVVSLVLWVGVCGMWVRSHWVRDYGWVWPPWPGDSVGGRSLKLDFDSGGGQVEISWRVWTAAQRAQLLENNELGGATFYHRTFPKPQPQYARSIPPTRWNLIGFKSYSGPTHTSVCFPYWLVALLTAGLPGVRVVGRLRRRLRLKAGRCAGCGYDLRATPERCPECGRASAN